MRIDSALFCNVIRILSLLLTFLLFGCQSASHDVRQIGREALTEAYIQLDSSNKTEAMRLFKEAEHYGLLADDTLTVAHARYNIALNLGYHADKEQTVSLLKAAVKDVPQSKGGILGELIARCRRFHLDILHRRPVYALRLVLAYRLCVGCNVGTAICAAHQLALGQGYGLVPRPV